MASPAQAASVIDNGTVQLGVESQGQLGTPGEISSPVEGQSMVGLRYLPTGNESLTHGCLCEGWGAGNGATGAYGFISTEFGNDSINSITFDSTDRTAEAITAIAEELQVSHSFTPSANDNLFEITISITNIGTNDIADLRYSRVINWNIEPEAYNEYLTFGGISEASSLLRVSTDASNIPNPFSERISLLSGNETVLGPGDLGSTFDFGFGLLRQDETLSFKMFYGAAANKALALSALGSVLTEVYAIGQAACDPDAGGSGCVATPNAFMVGFSGVGGTPLAEGDVPLPGGILLFLSGLVGLFTFQRKRHVKI